MFPHQGARGRNEPTAQRRRHAGVYAGRNAGNAEGTASGSDYGVGMSDNAWEYLPFGDATGDRDLEKGWRVAQLYGLAPGAVDRFGRFPDGFVASAGGDN
uniref:(northern house mosquito) hypothetical protein n=1 Tax=Culex pipiens TaxID=7175 RepID=A0A8D8DEF2_CULPI